MQKNHTVEEMQEILNKTPEELQIENKKKFEERHKTLNDVFVHCYCDLFELHNMVRKYRKLIIQHAPFNHINQIEGEIDVQLVHVAVEFAGKEYLKDNIRKTRFYFFQLPLK